MKKNIFTKKLLCHSKEFLPIISLIACANMAYADTGTSKEQGTLPKTVTKLPETVVIASRTEVALDSVSPSVTVVSAEELKNEQVRNVADSLSREVGIAIWGDTTSGTPSSMSIRGTSSSSTVIMLDGRRMNGGISGQYGLGTLTTDNLSSIQILRGSASTLYGSSAIGGAIDLRTINGLDVDNFTGNLWVEGGSWGTRRLGLQFAGNTNNYYTDLPANIGFSAGLSYAASDGYNWNNDYEQTNFLPRLDWKISDALSINLVGRVFEKTYGCPNADTLYTRSYTDREKDSGFMISPEVVMSPLENLSGKILYSYSESKSEGNVGGLVDNRNRAQQVSTQWDWQACECALVSFGYDFIQDDFFARGEPSFGGVPAGLVQYSNSVWTNIQIEPVKNLKFSAGLRYTDTNQYGDATTYELAGQYYFEPTGISIFAKISTGFRTPSYTDLSPNWNYVPDKDLEAEKSTSYEIGIKQELFDKQLKLGATCFLIDTKDKFAYRTVGFWPMSTSYVYNIDEARSNGIELSAEWTPTALEGISVYGNATFQDAWDRKTDTRLKGIPQFMGTIGAEYSFCDLTIGGSISYVKGREGSDPTDWNQKDMGNYTLARIYGNWIAGKHEDGSEKLTFFARIENVFDRDYDDYNIGYGAPGFGAYAGVKLSF